mmetsp:Transcript_87815/g.271969  ORF Transcript_87815/g.271969 Transcript_87815/m.271969 type:complete len:207 (-) Transcript_87815:351-971(-)
MSMLKLTPSGALERSHVRRTSTHRVSSEADPPERFGTSAASPLNSSQSGSASRSRTFTPLGASQSPAIRPAAVRSLPHHSSALLREAALRFRTWASFSRSSSRALATRAISGWAFATIRRSFSEGVATLCPGWSPRSTALKPRRAYLRYRLSVRHSPRTEYFSGRTTLRRRARASRARGVASKRAPSKPIAVQSMSVVKSRWALEQ